MKNQFLTLETDCHHQAYEYFEKSQMALKEFFIQLDKIFSMYEVNDLVDNFVANNFLKFSELLRVAIFRIEQYQDLNARREETEKGFVNYIIKLFSEYQQYVENKNAGRSDDVKMVKYYEKLIGKEDESKEDGLISTFTQTLLDSLYIEHVEQENLQLWKKIHNLEMKIEDLRTKWTDSTILSRKYKWILFQKQEEIRRLKEENKILQQQKQQQQQQQQHIILREEQTEYYRKQTERPQRISSKLMSHFIPSSHDERYFQNESVVTPRTIGVTISPSKNYIPKMHKSPHKCVEQGINKDTINKSFRREHKKQPIKDKEEKRETRPHSVSTTKLKSRIDKYPKKGNFLENFHGLLERILEDKHLSPDVAESIGKLVGLSAKEIKDRKREYNNFDLKTAPIVTERRRDRAVFDVSKAPQKWKIRKEQILQERCRNMELILKHFCTIIHEKNMRNHLATLWSDSEGENANQYKKEKDFESLVNDTLQQNDSKKKSSPPRLESSSGNRSSSRTRSVSAAARAISGLLLS